MWPSLVELATRVIFAELGLDVSGTVSAHVADPTRPMVVILGDRRADSECLTGRPE